MLAKCANPSCSTPLVYLREGKIFMIESGPQSLVFQSQGLQSKTTTVAAPLQLASKAQNRVEHFWLCGPCSSEMTLTFDRQQGVQVVPKTVFPPRAAAS
jgi:hypothetical protein